MSKFGRIWHLFLLSVFTFFPLAAQLTENDKYDYSDGDYYFSIEDYKQSVKFFLKLVNKYPENSKFNYRTGMCYLKVPGEENKALPYLQKAVLEIDPKYVSMNSKNSGAPPDAWLYLGDAFHRGNYFLEASQAYHNFKSYVEEDEIALESVKKRLVGLGISYETNLRPTGYSITNMGEVINSKYSDYNPVMSGDQQTLAYSSYRDPKDKILISYFTNGSWTEPADITAQIGSKGDFYTTALSFNGEELYISNYDPSNSDIFVSKKEKGKWTKMVPLDSKINSKAMESYASISFDGSELYFSSNRSGGIGGFDIYYSKKEVEGWSKPINLGELINTAGNEEAPYISYDGRTLCFSSDGHQTIGGMDYLYSTKDENGQWIAPVNLGAPINTPGDDISIIFFPDSRTGYLARIAENTENKRDLFYIQYIAPQEPVFEEIAAVSTIAEEPVQSQNLAEEPVQTPEIVPVIAAIAEPDPEPEPKQEPIFVETKPTDSNTEEKTVVQSQPKEYSFAGAAYTIQIMALLKPRDAAIFSKLNKEKLKVSYGNDGFARYTYGQFQSEEQAFTELKKLIKMGFKDAFIRNTSEISNY